MINDETRQRILRDDIDAIKAYGMAIDHHAEAALNGDAQSIAWVKASIKKWAQGEETYEPPLPLLRVAALHFLGNDAVVPLRRAEEYDLPPELDAARIAYQAVCNNADSGDQTAPFKERVMQFVRDNWPGTFSNDAIERIGRVANKDTKPGPKRKRRE